MQRETQTAQQGPVRGSVRDVHHRQTHTAQQDPVRGSVRGCTPQTDSHSPAGPSQGLSEGMYTTYRLTQPSRTQSGAQ